MAFIMDNKRAPANCAMKYVQGGNHTRVTWTMSGDVADFMPPVVRGYMRFFFLSEVSSMFDKGLEKLKATVESES